jgi:menaquinone-dependent protoporphyrinogen oxidase
MAVLIMFATVEGQTAKIARFAADAVRQTGQHVDVVDVSDAAVPLSFDDVDHVILAASVHERRHPPAFEACVSAHLDDLRARRTLMLSVSLSAAFASGMEEAQDYLTELEMRTDFVPDAEVLVAGAVRSTSYDYFASQVVRHVVLHDRDYDPDKGDHEFTDWATLAVRIAAFLAQPG